MNDNLMNVNSPDYWYHYAEWVKKDEESRAGGRERGVICQYATLAS
jgi:hypothetical protein